MYLAKEQVNIVDNLDLFARQVVEGFLTGLHKSPYHGFSVEFAEHRLYNTGDSVKNIDWKLFARSDRLFVKKFEDETNLRSHILIDTSSSMLYPNKFISDNKNINLNKLSFSLYASACLINLLHRQRDGVGLTFYNEQIDLFTQSRSGKAHYNRLMSELDKKLSKNQYNKNKKTNFSSIVSDFIEKIHKRSLIIIFSDMFNFEDSNSTWFEALQHLKYRKNEIILFHVQDMESEKLFNFSNQPHEFLDLENNSRIKMNPENYKENYQNQYNAFQKDLELKCAHYNIDYVPAFIEDGFYKVLLSYLTKRSKIV